LKALLGIPGDVFLASTITLGRPAGHHGPLRRKCLSDVVFDGRWDAPAEWVGGTEGLAGDRTLADDGRNARGQETT
jgi:hypothetical protein